MADTPLLERTIDGALQLAAAAASSGDWDAPRAEAYGKATALAASALQAAALGAGGADALQQLVDLTGQLAHRLTDLEGRTHV